MFSKHHLFHPGVLLDTLLVSTIVIFVHVPHTFIDYRCELTRIRISRGKCFDYLLTYSFLKQFIKVFLRILFTKTASRSVIIYVKTHLYLKIEKSVTPKFNLVEFRFKHRYN